jgi:hypothetical protein
MKEKELTAVEWLVDEIEKVFVNQDIKNTKVFEQAKEIEKEQRQEDTNYGYSQGWDDGNQNQEPMRPELKQQEQ